MKKLAFVFIFCCFVPACKDTEQRQVWRTSEARLTGEEWQQYKAEPAAVPLATDEPCPDLIETHEEALHVLVSRPPCTESAITALRVFAQKDKHALSDIAAAYFLRARSEERDSDLLHALEAAERAVAAMPKDPAALFNLALAQEALGLFDDASTSWSAVLSNDRSDWVNDARDHLRRLRAPVPQWSQDQLVFALQKRDHAGVRRVIAPFPYPALEFLEEEILAGTDPEAANLLASELSSRLRGDRYALDLAGAMKTARAGHVAYRAAKQTANPDYANVARLLKRGGSPLWIIAETEHVLRLPYQTGAATTSLTLLSPLEQEARNHHYEHLAARIQSLRAYVLVRESRHFEALEEYDAALKVFVRLGDTDKIGSVQRSRCGSYRELGQPELAWREGLKAVRSVPRIFDPRIRNAIFGEIGDTAVELGVPSVALHYENAALRMIQSAFREVPQEQIENYKKNIAARRRSRAEVEARLERFKDANADLLEAKRLMPTDTSTRTILSAIQAQIHEVEGRMMLRLNPNRAAASFTEALKVIPQDELRTVRASLYAQRAEAARLTGRKADAASDLESALRELRDEEAQMLARRQPGQGEQYWGGYFNRFRETWDRLIRQLVDRGDWQTAFDYSERSRAYEPLNLLLQRGVAPESFRKLVPHGEPMRLRAIQSQLAEGTFLLQYSLLHDRSETWIVSRNNATHITQRASRNDVKRWSEQLQRSSRPLEESIFRRTLQPPFEELFRNPLEEIRKMSGGLPKRLVIVPDGPMHGLPFAGLYDLESHQYLIQKMPIEIAPSATLYVFSLRRDQALPMTQPPSALLIGDPHFNDQLDLARGMRTLPRARQEVERIAGMYAPHAVVLTGDAATVSAFLAQAKNKTVVHIAAHAIVNPAEPWHSVLLFARSNEDSGAIDAEELLKHLNLDQTRLVVLSACSSAGGLPVGSEGVAPLVRPLLTAGVPAVLGTLWDVEDATAEQLSVSFHRHYGQSKDAAEALRDAQLDMLRSGNRGLQSLLAWAPFQVIGHASSPFESTQQRANGGTNHGIHRTHPFHRDDGVHPQ